MLTKFWIEGKIKTNVTIRIKKKNNSIDTNKD